MIKILRISLCMVLLSAVKCLAHPDLSAYYGKNGSDDTLFWVLLAVSWVLGACVVFYCVRKDRKTKADLAHKDPKNAG
jgi:hypothetical protein